MRADAANDNQHTDRPAEKEFFVSKYSGNFKGPLHEAVTLGGKHMFIAYNKETDEISAVGDIQEPTRTLLPPHGEDCPYEPYEFNDIDELRQYQARAMQENPGSLKKALAIARRYIDQEPCIVSLVAADTVWSYFQDRFPTTHYLHLVGDNGSGKSCIGETFASVGYRAVMMTDANGANCLRALGIVEPGQCTLVIDEVDDTISQDDSLRRVLKTGYHIRGRAPRINARKDKQEFYNTYGFKVAISRSMNGQIRLRQARNILSS
jgi:hypothetical protein